MIQRAQIEQILRINGVPITAPDEEIKSVLLSARWHDDDIETAIMVLRENKTSHKTHVDTVHKVFHSDDKLDPKAVSNLLGIEMTVTPKQVQQHRSPQSGLSMRAVMLLSIITLALSVIFVMAAMWYLQIGLFHQLR